MIGLACGVLVWAVTVGAGHVPLEGGTFEFGHPQRFAGTIVERPYPALRLDGADRQRDRLAAPGRTRQARRRRVGPWTGRTSCHAGRYTRSTRHPHDDRDRARLSRRRRRIRIGCRQRQPYRPEPFGDHPVTVRGEIVDSKCFLGVMVPGSGKTHKDCASLCLRGGIPPALFVQDRAGQSALMLLTGAAGEPIGARALQIAGEAVDMTGTIERQGGWLVLRTDPRTWQPVTRMHDSSYRDRRDRRGDRRVVARQSFSPVSRCPW